MKQFMALVLGFLLAGWAAARGDAPPAAKSEEAVKAIRTARDRGLDWLTKNQAKDGSWGKTYTIAVTSFSCLSYLSATDEPFTGDHAKALVKGLAFLVAIHKAGLFHPEV